MATMNVLVTGGAGYLGAVLVEQLLLKRHKVTVVDSFRHGVPSLLHLCADPDLTVIKDDARVSIRNRIKDFDVIMPLAAIVGAPACDLDGLAAHSTNEEAVGVIVRHASADQGIIFPNTNSGYGVGAEAECTEESPLYPISLYARTKANAEKRVLEHPNGVSLRFATLFGCSSRMRLDLLVNDFVHRAVLDRALTVFEGRFRRNYLHVQDAAAAFLFAMDNIEKMRGKAFNAGLSDANLTKLQLCARIRDQLPEFVWNESPIGEDPDKRDYVVSNAKLEALGWKPLRMLDGGISELIRAFSAMPFEQHRNAA